MREAVRMVRKSRVRLPGGGLPLRWRLTLVSFGLLAVLLGTLGVLLSSTMENTLLTNQATTLRAETCLALNGHAHDGGGPMGAPVSQPGLSCTVSGPGFGSLIAQLDSVNIHPALLNLNGTALLAANGTAVVTSSPSVTLKPRVVRSALSAANPPNYLLANDSNGARELVILSPLVVSNGQTAAVLQVSTPTAPIDGGVDQLRLLLFLGIGAALLLAAGLTLPLVRAALRPLVAMERTTALIAEGGDLSLRLAVPAADDEIGRLTRSFNHMVAQLEASFLRQKQFVADASHELRTPLTSLGGGLEMLLLGADAGDPQASRRLMRGMYAEVERMRRLVEDLLTLTRLDEGRLPLARKAVAVAPLMQSVAENAERLSRGQAISTEIAADLSPVLADGDRLKQVVLNLVENAVKYTPAEGEITLLAALADAEHVRLAVRDTGIGINPEALPHVFERFYRADTSRTRQGNAPGGSGLGLAIARSLIEAQGGTITVESTLGEGATFTVEMPLASAPPPLDVSDALPTTSSSSLAGGVS